MLPYLRRLGTLPEWCTAACLGFRASRVCDNGKQGYGRSERDGCGGR